GAYGAGRTGDPQCFALSQASTTFFGCSPQSKDLPMRRFGICGRSSFQSDQLQAACCGERFCAGAKTTDGFTRNPRRALTRLNTEKLNTVNRRARSSEIVERLPRSGGSLGRKYEVRRAAMSAMTQSGHDPGQHLLPARPNLLVFEPESS